MKTITFTKMIEIGMTLEFPTITFKPEKVRVSDGPSSWNDMGYVPYFNDLSKRDYCKSTGMSYRDCEKILKQYVVETYGCKYGHGQVDWYVYSAKELNMPELPKITDNQYSDDHAKLVNMFKGL